MPVKVGFVDEGTNDLSLKAQISTLVKAMVRVSIPVEQADLFKVGVLEVPIGV